MSYPASIHDPGTAVERGEERREGERGREGGIEGGREGGRERGREGERERERGCRGETKKRSYKNSQNVYKQTNIKFSLGGQVVVVSWQQSPR